MRCVCVDDSGSYDWIWLGWFSGKALSIALAEKGIFVTVVDFSEERGKEVALLVEKANSKFHSNLGFPSAIFVKCDVSNSSECLVLSAHEAFWDSWVYYNPSE